METGLWIEGTRESSREHLKEHSREGSGERVQERAQERGFRGKYSKEQVQGRALKWFREKG